MDGRCRPDKTTKQAREEKMKKNDVAILLAAGALVAGLAAAPTAEAFEPKFVDGVLQPLPDGFPNQPITLINVDEAGSSSGLYVRSIQQALEGISPVDIRIADEPRAAGGTVHTLAEVVNEREGGDQGYFLVQGSTIGTATDFLTEPTEKETGISFDDVNFLITTEAAPWLILQRKDAPWGRGLDNFVKYAKEHPGEIKYVSPGVGGGLDIFTTWVMDRLGVQVNKVPAANREASMAAVGGGAGDITANNATSTLKALDKVDILLVSVKGVPKEFEGANSAEDYPKFGIEDLAFGSFQGFILSKKVPEEHAQWLHALLAAAAETDAYKQKALTTPGTVIGVTSTEETNAQAKGARDAALPIVKAAGLYWEDNK
jgi:tripartite-type tricarboxylate transporter receptor subunit TctC